MQLESAYATMMEGELQYIEAVSKVLNPEQRVALQKLLKDSPQVRIPQWHQVPSDHCTPRTGY